MDEGRRHYFDGWYADMATGDGRDRLATTHLGLPPGMLTNSPLPLAGLREVAARLAADETTVVLDLACGRGGQGAWVARSTGCRLVGIDFSSVAVARARDTVDLPAGRALFAVADMAATGVRTRSLDAVMCLDAVQFAPDPAAVGREIRRVLRPGGRAVLTCWEPVRRDDRDVPDRLRALDLAATLAAGGLTDVVVEDRPDWHAADGRFMAAAAACDPGGDQGLSALRDEARRVAAWRHRIRRVLATGLAPD